MGKCSKKPGNKEGNSQLRNRNHEILFIDAREQGTMISPKQRELTDTDIAKVVETYHNWKSPETFATDYKDVPGFCKSATIEDVRKNNYILTPGRYIDFKAAEDDGVAFEEKMQVLTATLAEQMQKANELDEAIKVNLKKIGFKL